MLSNRPTINFLVCSHFILFRHLHAVFIPVCVDQQTSIRSLAVFWAWTPQRVPIRAHRPMPAMSSTAIISTTITPPPVAAPPSPMQRTPRTVVRFLVAEEEAEDYPGTPLCSANTATATTSPIRNCRSMCASTASSRRSTSACRANIDPDARIMSCGTQNASIACSTSSPGMTRRASM